MSKSTSQPCEKLFLSRNGETFVVNFDPILTISKDEKDNLKDLPLSFEEKVCVEYSKIIYNGIIRVLYDQIINYHWGLWICQLDSTDSFYQHAREYLYQNCPNKLFNLASSYGLNYIK